MALGSNGSPGLGGSATHVSRWTILLFFFVLPEIIVDNTVDFVVWLVLSRVISFGKLWCASFDAVEKCFDVLHYCLKQGEAMVDG